MGVELSGVESTKGALKDLERAVGGRAAAIVGTDVEYAPHVEFGTGPHRITPDTAEALRFEVGGEVVFAQEVMHPGTPAQPFMRPALNRTRANLLDVTSDADSVEDAVRMAAMNIERIAKRKVPVDTGRLRSSIRFEML